MVLKALCAYPPGRPLSLPASSPTFLGASCLAPMLGTVDACYRYLHVLGWSVGDVGFHEADARMVWLVTATRDREVISAKGRTQSEAWREAVRWAGQVGRGG